jgi:hypothetical protein
VFWYTRSHSQNTRSHSLLVDGVVTASSQVNRNKSSLSNCDIYVTCVDVRYFLRTVLELNLCCAICISRDLTWQGVCYLTLSLLLFGTSCVVVITESQMIGVRIINTMNELVHRIRIFEIRCTTKWLKRRYSWKNAPQAIFLIKQNSQQATLIRKKMSRRPDFLTESWWQYVLLM